MEFFPLHSKNNFMIQSKKLIALFLIVLTLLIISGASYYFFVIPKPTTQITNTEIKQVVFDPEIPVNEYWDWGEFNNLHIYINNTDKNIIYALDDTGKIIWTIWGKDYGINGFEIFRKKDKLFIKDTFADELKTDWSTLWVFDGNGQLKWKHTFKGYLDLPQMLVTANDNLIIENRSDNQCNAGCGIICREDLKNYCHETQTWAFNIDTGKIVWRNNTPNYYGHYLELGKNGKFIARSGGIGAGRLIHEYVVDANTGMIESQKVSIDDREFNQDKENALTFDLNAKEVYLHKRWTDEKRWSLNEQSFLYKWIYDRLNGEYKTVILDDIILSYGVIKKGQTDFLAFSKENGKLLWQKQYDTTDLIISPYKIATRDEVLLLNLRYVSRCGNVCQQCSGWVCFSKSDTDECKVCQEKDKARADYVQSAIWAIDVKTGDVIWKKPNMSFNEIDENNLITAGSVKLDLRTGKENKETR